MIIRGGENIYPKEIEDFIYTHPKVKDVQVIGVPDSQYGEEIMACVILNEGETMTEDELKEYVLTHMAKHKVPRYVDFVDSFPLKGAFRKNTRVATVLIFFPSAFRASTVRKTGPAGSCFQTGVSRAQGESAVKECVTPKRSSA